VTDVVVSAPAVREVPGVGRLTVPDDHPDLVAFLYGTTRDAGVIGIFSDFLRDRDDGRADLVADLATPGMIPDCTPGRDEAIPLVPGRDWYAVRRPNGVRGRVYPGTRLAGAILAATGEEDAGGWDGSPYRFEHRISRERQSPARVRAALDCCRGRFLFRLFGTCRLGVIALRSLHTRGGVADVQYTLRRVNPAAGARWLRDLMDRDPRRFRAILADELMPRLLRKPEYAAVAAEAGGLDQADRE
jgi:hypothetical protein